MKYYKVVDRKGNNGLIYKEGYNEDPKPFNPTGDCRPGGIYFARKDIFAFWDLGDDIYEVKPVGKIYKNPGTTKKYKSKAVNLRYIGEKWDIKVIKRLIKEGADIHSSDDFILRWASENGYLEIVKYLVETGTNMNTWTYWDLDLAIYNEHVERAKYLIEKRLDIGTNNNPVLSDKIKNNNLIYKIKNKIHNIINYYIDKDPDDFMFVFFCISIPILLLFLIYGSI